MEDKNDFVFLQTGSDSLQTAVSKWWFEFGPESKFPHPILTSILPLFDLKFTSFEPSYYLKLTSAQPAMCTCVTFIPRGIVHWLARVGCVR